MMRWLTLGLFVLTVFTPVFNQTPQRTAQSRKDEQGVRRLEDEWLGAYLRGDRAAFDRIVAEVFTSTDESATVRDKAQEREVVQAPPS